MTIAFTPRKESLSSIVYARQKADGKAYCYFSTPVFCQTFEELLDHAECNHDLVKSMKVKARSAGQFANALMKHASDLRIHSLAILRRSHDLRCEALASHQFTSAHLALWTALEKKANRTYKLKT
jgi:hypothetical protein